MYCAVAPTPLYLSLYRSSATSRSKGRVESARTPSDASVETSRRDVSNVSISVMCALPPPCLEKIGPKFTPCGCVALLRVLDGVLMRVYRRQAAVTASVVARQATQVTFE